ncbi:MAG: hypothetical protein KC438_04730 [Thermomicrobiales bacterium]|nr:hypothetical protein [Thermomicrobiales bacterium]MCO5221471.1 hypothetical protein [Thermomicrobiales bacterium]
MSREYIQRLLDAIEAIDRIEHYTRDMTRSEFAQHERVPLIVERLIMIAGEALDRAKDLDATLGARIPSVLPVIAVGQQILHNTRRTDSGILWVFVTDTGPEVRDSLRLAVEERS